MVASPGDPTEDAFSEHLMDSLPARSAEDRFRRLVEEDSSDEVIATMHRLARAQHRLRAEAPPKMEGDVPTQ
jgi:hypothetical protein